MDEDCQPPVTNTTPNSLNRYSMPVTRSRNGIHDMTSIDQTNTARFLFGDENEGASTSDINNFLKMNATDDKFPILVRRDYLPGVVSFLQYLHFIVSLTATCSSPHPLQLLI